jgi:hypothetical protein
MHDRNDLPPQGPFRRVEIERPRVVEALGRWADVPVHILCAPHGGGKTTALLQYAAQHGDVPVLTLQPRASRAQVLTALASVAAAQVTVIDRADVASPAGQEALLESIEVDCPQGRRYVLGGTSRTAMRMQPFLARGIATLTDAAVLPFDIADIEDLARAYAVAADARDIERLRYDTDGWPLAVSWVLRDAARDGRALRGAFERWRVRSGHLLLEFVTVSHDSTHAKAFVSALWSLGDATSQRSLDRLEGLGYPIVRMRTGLRPYRVLVPMAAALPADAATAPEARRLVLTLFGRFACRIADQPVTFARRRDRNVLAYVALAPRATVTRAELLATFWPEASRAVASQGLRTTLCRLRHAVAEAAGCDAGRYLRIDESVGLHLEWATVDARAFRRSVELAAAEDADGNRDAAHGHYLQAERLYTDSLLASEGVEGTLRPRATEYEELAEVVSAHLASDQLEAVADREVDPVERAAGELDDRLRGTAAQREAIRAYVPFDPQRMALAIDEHNVDRKTHADGVNRMARGQPDALVVLEAGARQQPDRAAEEAAQPIDAGRDDRTGPSIAQNGHAGQIQEPKPSEAPIDAAKYGPKAIGRRRRSREMLSTTTVSEATTAASVIPAMPASAPPNAASLTSPQPIPRPRETSANIANGAKANAVPNSGDHSCRSAATPSVSASGPSVKRSGISPTRTSVAAQTVRESTARSKSAASTGATPCKPTASPMHAGATTKTQSGTASGGGPSSALTRSAYQRTEMRPPSQPAAPKSAAPKTPEKTTINISGARRTGR